MRAPRIAGVRSVRSRSYADGRSNCSGSRAVLTYSLIDRFGKFSSAVAAFERLFHLAISLLAMSDAEESLVCDVRDGIGTIDSFTHGKFKGKRSGKLRGVHTILHAEEERPVII